MSQPNNASAVDVKRSDDSCCGSPEDCTKDLNSKDVNLNSKSLPDFNALFTEQENKEIKDCDRHSDIPKTAENANSQEDDRFEELHVPKKSESTQYGNVSENLNSTYTKETKTQHIPVLSCSTPKPESSGFQMLCGLFSINTNTSKLECENDEETSCLGTILQNNSLSDEEIGKRFQELSFAFKTDSMTIHKRLNLMKRKRDQSELNIENELKIIKTKLNLSSSAEGFGYVQHEERFLELVSAMIQHVENVETLKNETSKILDKLKAEGKKPVNVSTENDTDDERIVRRRSVTALAVEGSSRRRASIATIPRIASSVVEGGGNGKGPQWISSRTPGIVQKKLSFSQPPSSRPVNGINGEESRRESVVSRHRTDSRTSESSMKNIEEHPEQRSFSIAESETFEQESGHEDFAIDPNDSTLHLRQLQNSFEGIRQSSVCQESVNPIYCLRRIFEWNKKVLNSARFQWPEDFFHYVPFYLTWYVVFILALIFATGLFLGANGCFTYLGFEICGAWFAALTFSILFRRYNRLLLRAFFLLILIVTLLLTFLTRLVLPGLSYQEVDSILRTFGLILEVRYLNGSPPI